MSIKVNRQEHGCLNLIAWTYIRIVYLLHFYDTCTLHCVIFASYCEPGLKFDRASSSRDFLICLFAIYNNNYYYGYVGLQAI